MELTRDGIALLVAKRGLEEGLEDVTKEENTLKRVEKENDPAVVAVMIAP